MSNSFANSDTPFEYFDTHSHINQRTFDEDRAEVIKRANAAAVSQMLAIGTDVQTSIACVELAADFDGVYAAVGIQPNDVQEAAPGDWERIVELVDRPGVVALGETGLDKYWDHTPFDQQQDFFDQHIRLSQERKLPVVIHMRECEAEVIEMLRTARQRGEVQGVMHSYTGTAAGAQECVELGLYVSFAGMVTYKKSDELRTVAKSVPSERILIETDSPYLSPVPMRKMRRNEPANVVHTAACLAEVRGTPLAEFVEQTTANARRLFLES